MKFTQFRAKVFMLSVMKELDQIPSITLNNKFGKNVMLKEAIEELMQEFGSKELEGIKILAKYI